MASNAAKVKRRAEALNELSRLSNLVAEHVGIEVPDVSLKSSRDPELSQILQVEAINGLLTGVLEAQGVEVKIAPETQPEAESSEEAAITEAPKTSKKKAGKKLAKKSK